jgi:hypothetical protein
LLVVVVVADSGFFSLLVKMKKKFSRSIVHKATAQRERHPMQGIHFFSLKKEMNRFRGVGTSVHTHESQTKEKHEEYLTTTSRA